MIDEKSSIWTNAHAMGPSLRFYVKAFLISVRRQHEKYQ